jgi:hypothetical protein
MKNHNKGFATSIVFIVITIFVLGASAYFYYLNDSLVSKNNPLPTLVEYNPAPPENTVSESNIKADNKPTITTKAEVSPKLQMKVNGEIAPFTTLPQYSNVEIVNGKFNIVTTRKEGGLFELTGFDTSKLKPETFSGKDFNLLLISSPYKEEVCTDEKYKNNSKLVIEEYGSKIKGYYSGKLDCDTSTIEFTIFFDEMRPDSNFYTTN